MSPKKLKSISVFLGLFFLGGLSCLAVTYFKSKMVSSCPVRREIKTVRGNSLEPLVPPESKVRALFGYYECHKIKRNDLVLYQYGGDEVPLLKIVKGIPQDTFQMISNNDRDYNLLINGKAVLNSKGIPYVFSGNKCKMLSLYEKDYKGTIPRNTYLLLGDQPNGSVDSSAFGLVDKSDILGKAEKMP